MRHARDWNLEFVAENAALPYRSRQLVFRSSDALSGQICGPADPAVRVDEDAVVPEHARRKDGNRDELRFVCEQGKRVRRQRHLRDIEFVIAEHSKERLFHDQGQIRQFNAVE